MMKKIQNVKDEVVDIVEDIKITIDGLKKEDFSVAELESMIGRINQLHEQAFMLKYLLTLEQQAKEESQENEGEAKSSSIEAEKDSFMNVESERNVTEDSLEHEKEPISENVTKESEKVKKVEEEPKEESSDRGISVEDDSNENTPDLNEIFSAKDDPSLSGQLKKQPVADLLTAIGLNERYLYANELFAGNIDEFREAIRILNEFDDLDQAKEYFNKELKRNYEWDDDNELSEALLSLVERRYL